MLNAQALMWSDEAGLIAGENGNCAGTVAGRVVAMVRGSAEVVAAGIAEGDAEFAVADSVESGVEGTAAGARAAVVWDVQQGAVAVDGRCSPSKSASVGTPQHVEQCSGSWVGVGSDPSQSWNVVNVSV